jgi:hypothetical protein
MKRTLTVLLACIFVSAAFAQSNFGKLQGKVSDSKTKAPIAYATIIIEKDGIRKGGAYTGVIDAARYFEVLSLFLLGFNACSK